MVGCTLKGQMIKNELNMFSVECGHLGCISL
jgi:hypothetical protein